MVSHARITPYLLGGLGSVLLAGAALAAAVALGGPSEPPALERFQTPFVAVDYAALPALERYAARDGARLAFRRYAAARARIGSAVLVHGSSASSNSMHALAMALAQAGYDTFALDIRGHGGSGTRGHIAYEGQLEDDVEDFLQAVRPARPAAMVGFSSGGGFALRFAADARGVGFECYVLLSPFLGQDAPTERPEARDWGRVGVPRIIALSVLDGLGIHAGAQLPVIRFALTEEAKAFLTPTYSLALAQNFRPQRDYRRQIRTVQRPVAIVAGAQDELFHADRFAAVFRAEGKEVPVTLVPGLSHIPLILDDRGHAATVQALASGAGARP